MVVTELTCQLDRSELKEEASKNTARDAREEQVRAEGPALGKQKRCWRSDALYVMSVTKLTSHEDRSEVKDEAS